jgi:hypothetical protein
MKTIMSCLAIFAMAVFTSTAFAQEPTPATASDGPTLTSVEVKFDTTTDNKNPDSLLDVYIKTNHGHEIAKSEGNRGVWNNNSTHTLTLQVEGVKTREQIRDGSVALTFHPHGADKWEFNYKVTLKFSDDSTIIKEFNDCRLTQHDASRTDAL